MSEFFNLFAYVYANLVMYDLDNYGEDTADVDDFPELPF